MVTIMGRDPEKKYGRERCGRNLSGGTVTMPISSGHSMLIFHVHPIAPHFSNGAFTCAPCSAAVDGHYMQDLQCNATLPLPSERLAQ